MKFWLLCIILSFLPSLSQFKLYRNDIFLPFFPPSQKQFPTLCFLGCFFLKFSLSFHSFFSFLTSGFFFFFFPCFSRSFLYSVYIFFVDLFVFFQALFSSFSSSSFFHRCFSTFFCVYFFKHTSLLHSFFHSLSNFFL